MKKKNKKAFEILNDLNKVLGGMDNILADMDNQMEESLEKYRFRFDPRFNPNLPMYNPEFEKMVDMLVFVAVGELGNE